MLIVAPPTRWVEGGGRHFKQSNVSGENRCIPLPLFLGCQFLSPTPNNPPNLPPSY